MANSSVSLVSGYFFPELVIEGAAIKSDCLAKSRSESLLPDLLIEDLLESPEMASDADLLENWSERASQRLSTGRAVYYIEKISARKDAKLRNEGDSTAALLEQSVAASAGFGELSGLLSAC
jgi:KaiC/GvpD/RAD55 family RecA-like ATPase